MCVLRIDKKIIIYLHEHSNRAKSKIQDHVGAISNTQSNAGPSHMLVRHVGWSGGVGNGCWGFIPSANVRPNFLSVLGDYIHPLVAVLLLPTLLPSVFFSLPLFHAHSAFETSSDP